jgi:hypothetical protein
MKADSPEKSRRIPSIRVHRRLNFILPEKSANLDFAYELENKSAKLFERIGYVSDDVRHRLDRFSEADDDVFICLYGLRYREKIVAKGRVLEKSDATRRDRNRQPLAQSGQHVSSF